MNQQGRDEGEEREEHFVEIGDHFICTVTRNIVAEEETFLYYHLG